MQKEKKKELLRMVKFALFSISAGLIEMVSFTLLNELTGWSYWPCYLTALVLSVLWNFTLNRKFTFQSAGNVPMAMLRSRRSTLCSRLRPRCWEAFWRRRFFGTSIW